VGSVEAFENVQVTARVAGVALGVHFKEGDTVKKDALLIEIEPERYQLAYAAAKASLDRAEASRAEAERELERVTKMNAEGVATAMDVGNWTTKLATARAEEASARASLGVASLNLREARLRAPSGGVIQTKTVQTGQYVQPGTVLATLIQRDPLLLRFKIADSEASQIKAGMEARFKVKESERTFSAKLTHVAGAAEEKSRMVPVVAEIGEGADTLRPGAFAEVQIPVGSVDQAVVAPQTAIRPSERGFLAYVIEGDVARERVLTLGMRTSDGQVEVKRGLNPQELLVIRGAEALKEGSKVKVGGGAAKPASAPSPASGT
jgi:membrane fusion protein (multidrug efflux system)/multidrug efflux system membrane fusion protein